MVYYRIFFFFSSRRRHTRCSRDWSSDVCSSDLNPLPIRFVHEYNPRQVLKVDLVHDSGVGWNDRQIMKRLLPPAQERVALLVAEKFQLGVQSERLRGAKFVDLHRVINHQLGGL